MNPKGLLHTLPRPKAERTRRGVRTPGLAAGCRLGAGFGLALALALLVASASAVRINEVSDTGTPSACDGEDWVELSLSATATAAVDLGTGYVLHDDKGADDEDALNFAALAAGTLAPLEPGDYLLLCRGAGAGEFSFGIGVDDTVTLLDAEGVVASTTGELPGKGDDGITYAYDDATGEYAYTSTPTPGEANEITSAFETVEEMKARLIAQEAEGTAFFNMDGNGKEVEDGFPAIVDLRIEMDPDVRVDMHDVARSHATYRPWLSAQVLDADGGLLLDLKSPGRIRPKGQYTLYEGTCMDKAVPYGLDFGKGADGSDPAQTLFGVERAFLRKFGSDASGSREWTAHRMLARFGLPHLRTRKVRLHINAEPQGLYELIEAPEQEYVYQRSFPDFDPASYGLYKVKPGTGGCPDYNTLIPGMMEQAKARVDEPNTPPYFFERGEHRPLIPVLKDAAACGKGFLPKVMFPKVADASLAYVRSGTDCGEFLVDAGLTARKLPDEGGQQMDVEMAAFIDNHLAANTCDPGCTNSNLAEDVDVTSFLRNLAVQAGVLHTDSPLTQTNMQNFFLAYNGGLWSMVQWDHNDMLKGFHCTGCVGKTTANWSILRPTCRAFETNQVFGPLLSDPDLRGQYVEYLREFVNDIMTDDGFLGQIEAHLNAIKDDMPESFLLELAVSGGDEDTWLPDLGGGQVQYTLLGMIRARATGIKKQLDAIDAGTTPRDLDDIAPDETCVDWTLDGPRSACSFCPGGLVDANTIVPDTDGNTCGMFAALAPMSGAESDYCDYYLGAQLLCCPDDIRGQGAATATDAEDATTTKSDKSTKERAGTPEDATTKKSDNGAAAFGWLKASVPTVAVTLLAIFS